MSAPLPVGVVGAGSFGLGLARAVARSGREVILYSRSGRQLDAEHVTSTSDPSALASAELIFVAVPSPFIGETADELGPHLDGGHLLVHVSRGLVGPELTTLSMVLRKRTPCRRVGALAGPLMADALTEGRPGGAIVGTRFPEVAEAVREALASPTLRLYDTRDVVGVEVASATVGLLSLATGYALGVGAGPAAFAVMLTRGMAEATRVGCTLDAKTETFSGLAGYGDLLAVVAGDERPEVRLGRALAQGADLEAAAKDASAHIEGVRIARNFSNYAARVGHTTPIASTVADVLEGKLSAHDALGLLMARRGGKE